MTKRWLLFCCAALLPLLCGAQPYPMPTLQQLHAHNDYRQPVPFWNAWAAGCGSIEIDLFWQDGQPHVAHDTSDLPKQLSLHEHYLDPIRQLLSRQNGRIYADTSWRLQLLVDIKNERERTLDWLLAQTAAYPDIFYAGSSVGIVLSGDRPPAQEWAQLPSYIKIDGRAGDQLSAQQWERVAMISTSFAYVSPWNGKGRLTAERDEVLQQIIALARQSGKPLRFWGTPDTPSAWQLLIKNGVDIIGTDQVDAARQFVAAYPQRFCQNAQQQPAYIPQYPDFPDRSKHCILLIGDGTGLAQLYAAYTANGGQLTLFNFRHTGWAHTQSTDSYCTDSAAGASSLASGQQTANRKIGLSPDGLILPQITKQLSAAGYRTGVITSVSVADATPAAFYARAADRDLIGPILQGLANSPLQLLAGEGGALLEIFEETLDSLPDYGKRLLREPEELTGNDSPAVLLLPDGAYASDSSSAAREAFAGLLRQSLRFLHQGEAPFFMVAESGRVDHGGHSNRLKTVVDEALSLDRAVAEAARFVDEHPETLLVVLADHETGGLSLLDGSMEGQWVLGQFSTDDHTGVAVPCFAYGPGAHRFQGVLALAEVQQRIMELLEGNQ